MRHAPSVTMSIALLVLLGGGAIAGPSRNNAPQQHSWSLSIDQTDDTTKTYVNSQLVNICTYENTCQVNLSDYLVSGDNTVKLVLRNNVDGYAYGYTFYEDGSAVMSASCGSVQNFTPCMIDQTPLGKVYTVSVVITN
jgi:hypothetical protein